MGQPPQLLFQLWARLDASAAAVAHQGVCLLVAAALSGCSGTRFGDQLARSFSVPEPASESAPGPAAASGTAGGGAAAPVSARSAAGPAKSATAGARAPAVIPGGSSGTVAPSPIPAPPGLPAPYRVTLRLPAADSSAPAERVTQALRAAGVRFEVEAIERIPASGDGGTAVDGSGSSGGTGMPRRTPAPPPR